jgi:hypothetical protein
MILIKAEIKGKSDVPPSTRVLEYRDSMNK